MPKSFSSSGTRSLWEFLDPDIKSLLGCTLTIAPHLMFSMQINLKVVFARGYIYPRYQKVRHWVIN